jgi:hypothetical protein
MLDENRFYRSVYSLELSLLRSCMGKLDIVTCIDLQLSPRHLALGALSAIRAQSPRERHNICN